MNLTNETKTSNIKNNNENSENNENNENNENKLNKKNKKNKDIDVMDMFNIGKKDIKNKKNVVKNDDSESDESQSEDEKSIENMENNKEEGCDIENDWSNEFINPSVQFEKIMNNMIKIKTQSRGRKNTTVIVGLELDKTKEKEFLTIIRTKMAVSGSKKKVKESEIEDGAYHKDKTKKDQPKKDHNMVDVYIFTGNCKDLIRKTLIENFDIDEESIIC